MSTFKNPTLFGDGRGVAWRDAGSRVIDLFWNAEPIGHATRHAYNRFECNGLEFKTYAALLAYITKLMRS